MTALLAKAGHAAGAVTWPYAAVLMVGAVCITAIVLALIVITARQGAKR